MTPFIRLKWGSWCCHCFCSNILHEKMGTDLAARMDVPQFMLPRLSRCLNICAPCAARNSCFVIMPCTQQLCGRHSPHLTARGGADRAVERRFILGRLRLGCACCARRESQRQKLQPCDSCLPACSQKVCAEVPKPHWRLDNVTHHTPCMDWNGSRGRHIARRPFLILWYTDTTILTLTDVSSLLKRERMSDRSQHACASAGICSDLLREDALWAAHGSIASVAP